jgi:hypothetical protein
VRYVSPSDDGFGICAGSRAGAKKADDAKFRHHRPIGCASDTTPNNPARPAEAGRSRVLGQCPARDPNLLDVTTVVFIGR